MGVRFCRHVGFFGSHEMEEFAAAGFIETPSYGKLGLPAEAVQTWAADLLKRAAAAGSGQASEIAHAALFLACDDSSCMAGGNLVIDGAMAST